MNVAAPVTVVTLEIVRFPLDLVDVSHRKQSKPFLHKAPGHLPAVAEVEVGEEVETARRKRSLLRKAWWA